MSKQSDNPADAFKKALAEATKVMSNDPDLTVSYIIYLFGFIIHIIKITIIFNTNFIFLKFQKI